MSRDITKTPAGEKLHSLLVISRCLGVLPRDAEFRLSKVWSAFAIIIRCWLAGITPYFISEAVALWGSGYFTKIRIFLTVCAELAEVVAPTLHIIAMIKNGDFWRRLWKASVHASIKQKHTAINIVLFAGIGSTGILKILDCYHYPIPSPTGNYFQLICSWLSDSAILVIIIQFCGILNILQLQIVKMNKKLTSNKTPPPLLLQHSMDEHMKYVALAKEANHIYSFQLLASCIALFTKFLSYLYDTVADILETGLDVKIVVVRISAALHFLLLIYFLVKTCQEFSDTADNFNYNLFEALRRGNLSLHLPEIRTYVLMKNKVVFTAAEFFVLDYPIITSMTTSALTFLVVIVQFTLARPLAEHCLNNTSAAHIVH